MRIIASLAILAALAGCAVPPVVLHNPETKQVVTCSPAAGAQFTGGMIGAAYTVEQCVQAHEQLGFVAVNVEEVDDTEYVVPY